MIIFLIMLPIFLISYIFLTEFNNIFIPKYNPIFEYLKKFYLDIMNERFMRHRQLYLNNRYDSDDEDNSDYDDDNSDYNDDSDNDNDIEDNNKEEEELDDGIDIGI